ncbi:MAG: hypothetical protein U0I51_09365, partial [Muricomes sp.]|nr:hypothetical protein [Muricomes sp.]
VLLDHTLYTSMPHPLVSRCLPLHIPLRLGFIRLQNLRFFGESDGRAGLNWYAVRFPSLTSLAPPNPPHPGCSIRCTRRCSPSGRGNSFALMRPAAGTGHMAAGKRSYGC